jgi:hypothetical protein
MRLRDLIFGAFLALLAAPVAAVNLFIDPAYPGEGWTFDNQNDVVGATWYTYTPTGQSRWAVGGLRQNYANTTQGTTVAQIQGELFEVPTKGATAVSLGQVQMVRTVEDGGPVYHVQGQGFTRRLVPYFYNYASLIDQFHGFWVTTAFDPQNLGEGGNARVMGIEFLGNGVLSNQVPVRLFVNPTTGTEGYLYYSPTIEMFVLIAFPEDGSPTRAFLLEGTDAGLFGVSVLVDSNGQELPNTEQFMYAGSPAKTDRSGQIMLAAIASVLPAPPAKTNMALLDVTSLGIHDAPGFRENVEAALVRVQTGLRKP